MFNFDLENNPIEIWTNSTEGNKDGTYDELTLEFLNDQVSRRAGGIVIYYFYPGIEYNLLYFDETANSKWQELSIDLVSVLVLSKDQRETYLQVINPLVDD